MMESVARGSGGNNQDGGAYGSFKAVGGTVYDRYLICALFLSGKGGRTAAVKVNGGYAACFIHDLRDLTGTAACGEGLLTAVKHH